MKRIGAALFTIMFLFACQTTQYRAAEPTASLEDAQRMRELLVKQIPEIEVSDAGLITLKVWVPAYADRWAHKSVRTQGYRLSCVDLKVLLERGFVSVIHFKGPGGSYQEYDNARCEAELKNNS